ncbi:ABC transporter substrate-binding protein [Acuticoccus sp. MNP-M23]|uniref:ABC transporter substrate-binding protein n=1 Tax=Acuticoccus sp. MNP-M23 TaxID=3072793 RepID=UPI002816101D|nr:ABC transporter substrate-binding protein [Acuticoccus sp. MNP-M23]WMS41430.1 ABC transporter substrate-binding protein [Acuticoccus sp. MNP-M23]
MKLSAPLTATLGRSLAVGAFAAIAAVPAHAQDTTVSMTVEASAIPAFIADDRGFFGDLDVEVSKVGYDQVQALLVAGDTDIAWMSPIETVQFVSEGSDFRYFSTAGAQNMYNGIVVQADNADEYPDVMSLEGKRLGIPGFGTGTWATFRAFSRAYYGVEDPTTVFDVVTASSGALLALVERGQVDAALLFSGSSAAARSLPQFKTIFSFTEAMQENAGQPMVINGAVATASWLKENPETAAKIVKGLDDATKWIGENTAAFEDGGEYADLARDAGWLAGPETAQTVLTLIKDGKWYLTSDAYTPEWIGAIYTLLEEGKFLETLPEQDAAFLAPGTLPAAQ